MADRCDVYVDALRSLSDGFPRNARYGANGAQLPSVYSAIMAHVDSTATKAMLYGARRRTAAVLLYVRGGVLLQCCYTRAAVRGNVLLRAPLRAAAPRTAACCNV